MKVTTKTLTVTTAAWNLSGSRENLFNTLRDTMRYVTFSLLLAGVLPCLIGAPARAQETGTVEDRLARVERLVQSDGLLDLLSQVEKLEAEVRDLRGTVETQTHQLGEVKAAQEKRIAELEQQLANLSSAAAGTPASGSADKATAELPAAAATDSPAPTTETAAENAAGSGAAAVAGNTAVDAAPAAGENSAAADTATAVAASPSSGNADQDYNQALNTLKAGKNEQAIAEFKQFLGNYPQSPRADSAQYWLGEAFYVAKKYDSAINAYENLLETYPKSQKVAQTRLKLGFAYYELRQYDEAQRVLEDVKKRYPGTTPAAMAENRLSRMQLERNP